MDRHRRSAARSGLTRAPRRLTGRSLRSSGSGGRQRRFGAAAISAGVALVLASCSSAAAVPASTTSIPPTTAPPLAGNIRVPASIAAPGQNLPDPFVLEVPHGYELYASQTGLYAQILPTSFSAKFGSWPSTHSAMPTLPSWATNGFTWAPDVRYLDGKYVMYFDSMAQPSLYYDRAGTGFSHYAQCIGTATSRDPGGPFVGSAVPLVCDFKAHGAIDPRTFLGSNGDLYLDWKSDDNAASPGPYPATHLYAQLLSRNGLALAGRAHLLLSADEPWQANIVEAPDMVEVQDRFWLFYSGSWFNSPTYGIGFAKCAGPLGPCRDLTAAGPFIGSNGQGDGPGEESVFEGTDGRWWVLYSPWFFGFDDRSNRPLAVAPIAFTSRPYVAARRAR